MNPVHLPDLSGLTLIVAEDTDDSLDVLTTYLRACGARVLAARNGLEALAYLYTTPEVDAIVTDLAMPQQDGGELRGQRRGNTGRKPHVESTLTGFCGQDMATRDAGLDPLLVKPVDLDQHVRPR